MNRYFGYRKQSKTGGKKKKWIVDEETAKKITDLIQRGFTDLQVKRLPDTIDEAGNVKENYDIKPVNEDGWI